MNAAISIASLVDVLGLQHMSKAILLLEYLLNIKYIKEGRLSVDP